MRVATCPRCRVQQLLQGQTPPLDCPCGLGAGGLEVVNSDQSVEEFVTALTEQHAQAPAASFGMITPMQLARQSAILAAATLFQTCNVTNDREKVALTMGAAQRFVRFIDNGE